MTIEGGWGCIWFFIVAPLMMLWYLLPEVLAIPAVVVLVTWLVYRLTKLRKRSA